MPAARGAGGRRVRGAGAELAIGRARRRPAHDGEGPPPHDQGQLRHDGDRSRPGRRPCAGRCLRLSRPRARRAYRRRGRPAGRGRRTPGGARRRCLAGAGPRAGDGLRGARPGLPDGGTRRGHGRERSPADGASGSAQRRGRGRRQHRPDRLPPSRRDARGARRGPDPALLAGGAVPPAVAQGRRVCRAGGAGPDRALAPEDAHPARIHADGGPAAARVHRAGPLPAAGARRGPRRGEESPPGGERR